MDFNEIWLVLGCNQWKATVFSTDLYFGNMRIWRQNLVWDFKFRYFSVKYIGITIDNISWSVLDF